MLWSLWAAKEAVFKALSRDIPTLVFSPMAFEVDPAVASGIAVVGWGEARLPVFWRQGPDWVHAWVADEPDLVIVQVEKKVGPGSDSDAVRLLAQTGLLAEGYPLGAIEGLPPVYQTNGGRFPVSLSHDGPYLAVAFLAWTNQRQP